MQNKELTNYEVWCMLKNKMEKNGFVPLTNEEKLVANRPTYLYDDVICMVSLAYRSGYERAMKGRPFKIGEKKKKGGHWEPVDPNNLPKEGTKVRYKGGLKGYNWEQNSIAKWIKTESDRFFIKFDGMNWTLACMNCLLKYFDMWVEDDE